MKTSIRTSGQLVVLALGLSFLAVGCGTTSGDVLPGTDVIEQDYMAGDDAFVPDDDSVTPGEDVVEPDEDVPVQDIPEPEVNVDEIPSPVVDSGQDRCFSSQEEIPCGDPGSNFFGQDGQYHGFQPKYLDNGDGTITDLVSGLMWQQDPGDKMTFDEAKNGADSFTLAGYDDWRLPSIKEAYSLIDFTGVTGQSADSSIPYIDPIFAFEYGDESIGERFIDSQFATSTEYVSTTMGGDHTDFGVNFADGRIKGYGTINPQGGEKTFFVLHVRGSVYGENDFVSNGDGTVADQSTGLTWMQADDGVGRNWEEALAYCEAMELGGEDDWRLPGVKELQGIVDYTRSPDTTDSAAIDPIFGATEITDPEGAPNFGYYWSNTTHLDGINLGTYASYVAFGRAQGFMEQPPESGNFQLLDVHGAGAQRSDPKVGDPDDYPNGHGPQGDVIGIYNLVRCVRGGVVFQNVTPTSVFPDAEQQPPGDCGNGTCDPGEEDFCFEDCGGEPQDGPTPCETQADCEAPDACPEDAALGCTCAPDPDGLKLCVPACNTDADCPEPPGMELTCLPEGFCVPAGGPPPR
jgi:hypothetical protein